MPYYKFKKNAIFNNTLETFPEVQFDINSNKIYLNNVNERSGAFVNNVGMVPVGSLNLYEMNIDRPSDSLIFPFVTKGGSFDAVGNVSLKNYFSSFEYGDTISGSYPLSASLKREHFVANHGTLFPTGSHVLALRETLNYYQPLSNHYAFSSSLGDKALQELSLLYVPAIFYGSKIYPGTTSLKLYISGTLVAEAQDLYRNGELTQVSGSSFAMANGGGSSAGVILYKEGVLVLTGSWNLSEADFDRGDDTGRFRWIDFAAGANDGTADVSPSASFTFNFAGQQPIETITMFADAPKSLLNFSTNPTLLDHSSSAAQPATSNRFQYKESENIEIFNTVSSSFYRFESDFRHQTFINKIGIYDDNLTLIAIANLATPIKKTNLRDFTFKLKLDI
jgi:hypothetical protein